MVKIKLSKKMMLTSDSRQFILNKIKIAKETKRDGKNEIIYRKGDELLFPTAFFPNLESVLKNVPSRIIMQSNIEKLSSAIRVYQEMIDQLLKIQPEKTISKIKRRKK